MGAKPQPCYNRIRAINDRVIMRLQCILLNVVFNEYILKILEQLSNFFGFDQLGEYFIFSYTQNRATFLNLPEIWFYKTKYLIHTLYSHYNLVVLPNSKIKHPCHPRIPHSFSSSLPSIFPPTLGQPIVSDKDESRFFSLPTSDTHHFFWLIPHK